MMHLTGWIQDKTRINLFYDDSYCLSLECYETNEDDCADIWNRLHSLAPKLTLSHEVGTDRMVMLVSVPCSFPILSCQYTASCHCQPPLQATLMEFPRGPNGLLGFGINEVGVVQKVDGLARSVGLQKNSRLLQVSVDHMCSNAYM